MKKNKLILLKNKQEHEQEDFESIQEIKDALSKIDDHYQVFTPDLQVFEHLVIAEQQRQKKKFVRELLSFILIALLIMSGLLTALLQVPIAFFIVQGVASISLPVYVYFQYKKRVMRT
ncbi:YxlC family protein [Fredinandcohnia quinoae]|uniref:YxlC family protein n=1 Tax=Fredinandcohnia quinoae TaxID=2918902 RepID=A0AAW5EB12_9BACI|nr:YxlC family protein [Fredinandcohnia sp. SECRCQ15]MCH1627067.1 YxlC family protein [Fredinandcohnia sp. SECRCQ15]